VSVIDVPGKIVFVPERVLGIGRRQIPRSPLRRRLAETRSHLGQAAGKTCLDLLPVDGEIVAASG